LARSSLSELKAISSDLTRLGFTEYESRIYVFLVARAGLTVYEISKHTGIPRPNVYSAVERLVSRDAVIPIGDKPARYSAIDPDVMLAAIADSTSRQCASLAGKLKKVKADESDHFAYAVFGDHVRRKLAEVLGDARVTIMLKATEELLLDQASHLLAAAKRGVACTIVMFGSPPPELAGVKNIDIHLHENNGVRLGIADQIFTVVRDSEEAFMANTFGEFYGVYSASPPVVRVAELLMRREVYLAEILGRFGPQIEKEFGPLMADLRRKFLAGEERKRFELAVRAAEQAEPAASPRKRTTARASRSRPSAR
jgi:sugar-specific transcriptional regulator TrmB